MGARSIVNGDSSLRPVSDGYDGQVTLVRVEIPKGFYADTNFQSGYFILSLNSNVGQQECEQTLGLGKDGKVLTEAVNGVDFRWRESESGGRGQASKVRQYVTFTNDTCYELELGVKTCGFTRRTLTAEVFPVAPITSAATILPATSALTYASTSRSPRSRA